MREEEKDATYMCASEVEAKTNVRSNHARVPIAHHESHGSDKNTGKAQETLEEHAALPLGGTDGGVVSPFDPGGVPPVDGLREREDSDVAAASVSMVRRLALVVQRAVDLALDVSVVVVACLLLDAEGESLAPDDRLNERHEVVALALLDKDDRTGPSGSVGTSKHVEVGEVRDGDSTVSLRSILLVEVLGEKLALGTLDRNGVLVTGVSRGEDQDIEGNELALLGENSLLLDLFDSVPVKLDVGAC